MGEWPHQTTATGGSTTGCPVTAQELTRANYSVHEAGHAAAACSRNLAVSVALEVFDTEVGQASAATYCDPENVEDYLFMVGAGIAAARRFGLGVAGTLKDWHDLDTVDVDDSLKSRLLSDATEFVDQNAAMIVRMAYSLFYMGSLDDDTTRKIYDGEIDVDVPQDFLDAVDEVGKTEWRLKA